MFPSPLGVIFSLILEYPTYPAHHNWKWFVSVSSRSYILSYHTNVSKDSLDGRIESFRLLSELYSQKKRKV